MTRNNMARTVRVLLPRWKKRLDINDWYVDWGWMQGQDIDGAEGPLGRTHFYFGQNKVFIRLRNDLEYHELRETLVHELLHIAQCEPVLSIQDLGKSGAISNREWDVFWAQYQRQMELAHDRVTKCIILAPGWEDKDIEEKYK